MSDYHYKEGDVLARENSKYSTLVGKSGWLYIWNIDSLTEKVSGKLLATDRELEAMALNAELRASWCRDRGIVYRHMIGPDKSAIYPEFLPDGISRGEMTLLDQCTSAWSDKERHIDFIDTASLLKKAGKDKEVYFRNDSHWNYWGALEVFNALAESTTEEPRPIRPFSRDEITTVARKRVFELAALADDPPLEAFDVVKPGSSGAKLVFESESARGKIQVFEKLDANLPRCVLFRDSYASFFVPFLAERCSRLTVLNTRHFWYDLVRRDASDVVVSQVAERFLHPFTPDVQARTFDDVFRVSLDEIVRAGATGERVDNPEA